MTGSTAFSNRRWSAGLLIAAVLLFLGGCTGYPQKVEPVSGFELDRYLGKWYEIARLDHSFERGLEQVTAEYSLRDDRGVRVVNRGYSPAENQENRWNYRQILRSSGPG